MKLYPIVFQKIIMPIGEAIRGTHIGENLKRLEKSQWMTPDQIGKLQLEKLQSLLVHAYEHVPYYHNVFDQLGFQPSKVKTVANIACLPLLTKEIIRGNIPDMMTWDFPSAELVKGASSGSTGEPLQYFFSKRSASMRAAALRRFWKWAGYRLGDKWVRVQLWPRSRHPRRARIDGILSRCTYIGSYQFDDIVIAESVRKTRAAHPGIIRGYTAPIYLMAKHIKEKGLAPISVQAVITHSETLLPHHRRLIEEQFQCSVYDTYGGECMAIAGQCECGSYHLNDEGVLVEFLKDDGTQANPGELANIIVTDLNNYAMPFIRYRIGDMGVPRSGRCDCGRGLSLMESVAGRDSDIIRTVDGKYVMVQFFVVLFETEPGVEQFQVIQDTLSEIRVKLVVNESFTTDVRNRIHSALQEGCGPNTKIRFEVVDEIPVTRSGKRRFVISQIEAGKA